LTANAVEKQDWNVRLDPLHLRPYCTASSIGKVVFHKNTVYIQSCQEVESLVAIRRGCDLVAGCFQHVFQRTQVLRVVLDAKNPCLAHQLLCPFDIAHLQRTACSSAAARRCDSRTAEDRYLE